MRVLYKKQINWTIALLLVGSGIFSSCSKDKEQVEETAKVEGTKLMLNVSGINESQPISTKGSQAKVAEAKSGNTKVLEFPEFDAVLQTDNNVPFKAAQSLTKAASTSGSSTRAAAIENGVKYRLYLFSQDGSQLISSEQFIAGTQGTIDVTQGTTYKWVALSYNTADDVPNVTSANTIISLPGGKDILYTSGEVSVPIGGSSVNVPINIMFNHKFARLGIELNTQGTFANMSGAKVAVAGIKTASIDIASGALSDLVSADHEIPFVDFKDINALYQDAKIAYTYTADPAAVTGGIKVNVSNLALEIDDNSTRQFSATPVNFSFNITPVLGNSHRLLVNLIESPLTVEGTRWARQNIYYQAGHNPYRFHHTYAHSNARNTYFSFKGLVPDQFGVNSDPCAQVYPTGVWRQASESDFRKLTGILGIGGKQTTYGSVNNRGYFEYDASGTAAPYPSNKLHFNFNGGSDSFAIINGILQINLANYGNRAELWTGTSGIDLGGLFGFGAWYYHADRGAFNIHNDDLTASLLNVSVIGVDLVETQLKNVRCVRN
ncbi:hypothetical protein [Sphingobacterium prati]|uniref:hypothetical protein n=1 Tax=Sphingobacterium prati TaxID=2737006 RepID=UPI001552368D|nr:hypothetical protein [Sphingobacterium prati]NPE47850.1 hypothetical protein [Sphingobacterium prati]